MKVIDSMLFYLIPLIPLLGLLPGLVTRRRLTWLPPLVYAASLVASGFALQSALVRGPQTVHLALPGPFTPTFRLDGLSGLLVFLAVCLWFVLSIYSTRTGQHDPHARRFEGASLLTLAAVAGVFLAGDWLTLLLFFELMTVASYFWVIHHWDDESIRAGYFYLFFSIMGGLLLALGLVFLGQAAGGLPALGAGPVAVVSQTHFRVSLYLLLAGFGIKAGLMPLHFWLPHAHAAAPTPASALLSGLVIKVGAYGLLRVSNLLGPDQPALAAHARHLGTLLIILGLVSMLAGAGAALFEDKIKKMLAYSSISQMGYIVLGIGLALLQGTKGNLAFLGAVYHMVNHALFKGALFLGVGIVILATGKTDLSQLGGLRRRFPITALLMLVAALAMMGTPGLNGYASKTILHHAVSEAAGAGPAWLVWVERLFLVAGVGTAATFSKLLARLFLGPVHTDPAPRQNASALHLALVLLVFALIGLGTQPQWLLQGVLNPLAVQMGWQPLVLEARQLFWTGADLASALVTLLAGFLLYVLLLRTGALASKPVRVRENRRAVALQSTTHWLDGTKQRITGLAMGTRERIGAWLAGRRSPASAASGETRGIGADVAVVIITLIFLIAWYVFTDFHLLGT